jgi:hypothetical protein
VKQTWVVEMTEQTEVTPETEDMMWVHFLSDFSYKPNLNVTIDYKADSYVNVTTPCAAAAIDAGAAVKEDPPEGTRRAAAVKVRQKPAET